MCEQIYKYIHTHIYEGQRREQEHRQDLDVGGFCSRGPRLHSTLQWHLGGGGGGGGGGLGARSLRMSKV